MRITKAQKRLDVFLEDFAREIYRKNNLPERARAYTSVTLRRRFRGRSKSDLLGNFSSDGTTWLGDGADAEMLMDMHSFQIVKSVIRANQAAMVQAKVECTIEPSAKNKPELAGAAAVANGIYKYINNHPDYWSNNLENQTQQQVQTDYGCFIHTYHDCDAESPINLKIDEYSDQPQEEPGKYVCASCGAAGPLFSEQMGQANDNDTMPCLQCGEMAEIEEMPQMSDVPVFKTSKEVSAGNTVQEVVSAYQIRIDERKTKSGNLRKARWLEHHFLMDEDDLQAKVPYFQLSEPMEWSFPIKWEYCLETGSDVYLKPWSASVDTMDERRPHEVRRIYMRPSQYRHYVAPEDYDMDRGDGQIALNQEGNPMLSIKAGQRLTDIYPNGFVYTIDNERLVPWAEACDLLDEWSYMYYLNDSASYWGQPASELNELARSADNLWTIEVQHLESSSIATTVYDRNFFDPEAFEAQLSPTREGKYLEANDDIGHHFKQVQPPSATGAMTGIEFVRSIVGDVGGPQPATLGRVQPGVAYASQALQREQSLGLLTPSQQSKAECKATVTVQHLKFAQRTRPDEWFQHIRTMYGEEWKDQDIQAFLDCNVDLDLTVGYKESSIAPQSLVQRELKIRQTIMDLAEVAKAIGKPELISPELLSQYMEVTGIQYDILDTQADERLAATRYNRIKARLAEKQDSGMVEADLVAYAMADRSLAMIMEHENHAVEINFLNDHATALLGEDDPDFALVECALEMIKRLEDAAVKFMQTTDANALAGKAPSIAAQIAAAQAQGAAAAEAEKAKADAQTQQKQAELNAKIQMSQQELAAKAEEAERDRQHEADKTGAELAVRSAEVASKHPGPHDPAQKVSESISYEKIPPKAQAALLEQVGLPSEGVEEVHAATVAAEAAKAKQQSASRPLA